MTASGCHLTKDSASHISSSQIIDRIENIIGNTVTPHQLFKLDQSGVHVSQRNLSEWFVSLMDNNILLFGFSPAETVCMTILLIYQLGK